MKITVTCPQCGQQFSREFDTTKVNRVMAGELVQDVFPELSADERELFFITHICPKCWDDIFNVLEVKSYEEEDIDKIIDLELANSK